MMWAAGTLAAMSSLSYPAISALISCNADADKQGMFLFILFIFIYFYFLFLFFFLNTESSNNLFL